MVEFSGTVTSDFLKLIPADLDNKDKLIDFTSSDFNSIRAALINYAKAVYPLDYDNFSESDLGMFLIELMASVGHIQSIKSDFLANENFLRTARNRKSIQNLLGLIGVRLKGPISAAANATITVDGIPSTSYSSIEVAAQDRVVTITSPEDSNPITYTLYRVNSDGTVDLTSTTNSITATGTVSDDQLVVSDLVLLEGALVVETGVFQSPESVKSITLSQFPYVERSAQVYVQGNISTAGVYSEEENVYFASGGSDKIFQIVTDDRFLATVVFGDSSYGMSPAVGDTYTVLYRVGGGSRGNIRQEFINSPIIVEVSNGVGVLDVDAGVLENSGPATGGADAESLQHAKKYAPLTFRRQDRLVTLPDYKSFVNSFISNYGSTGKANAVVRRAFSSANIIDIFVLEKASSTQLRRSTPEYKRQLLEAISEKKMLTDEPVIVDGLIRTLDLQITVTLDSKYRKFESEIKSKVNQKILTYFDTDNSDFGEAFTPQDLVKDILSLTEIRYAVVDNVESTIKVEFNEIIQLNNLTIKLNYI